MKFTKTKEESEKIKPSIILDDGNNILKISKNIAGDLFWELDNPGDDFEYDKEFTLSMGIDKWVDEELYNAFDELFHDVARFSFTGEELSPIEIVKERTMYRYNNISNYNELYYGGDITWYSDEVDRKVANHVTLERNNNCIYLTFHTGVPREDIGKDIGSNRHIPIKFGQCNSRYDHFNMIFYKQYNRLLELAETREKTKESKRLVFASKESK